MHNLVIDIGNTNSKLAVFNGKTLVHYQRLEALTIDQLAAVLNDFPVKHFTLSSVNTEIEPFVVFLKQQLHYVPFSTRIDAGIRNTYKTIDTLGPDRWAKVIAAHRLYAGYNCLIIDAGTCVTYDVLKADGRYKGGSISPGIGMRFAALQHYTGKLPLVSWNREEAIPEGDTTANAIRNGVLKGVVHEVEGIIAAESKQNAHLQVLITGGDAEFLKEQLKNSIFASQITHDPYLVLKGLNEVITL